MTSHTDTITIAQTCCRDSHLRHCHGTWLVHADGTCECTTHGCETPTEGHAHVVPCAELAQGCRCR